MIVDTHVHYNLDPLFSSWETYWQEAQAAGVEQSIVVGESNETNLRAILICEHEPGLYCAVGIHPEELNPNFDMAQHIAQLDALLAKKDQKIVAIGECGLDYYRLSQDPTEQVKQKQLQKTLFGKQIALAKKHDLPLIIHSRDAATDLLDTIHHFSMSDGVAPKAVLHCMSGTLDYLERALSLGFYISYAGNVTYKNAENLRELVKNTPQNRILVETDAPFLSPLSMRGKPCHPKYITETLEALAALQSIKVEEMAGIIKKNAADLFRLPFDTIRDA